MQTIIFLNGEIPGKSVVNHFLKKKSFIIAADGGANYLRTAGIAPDAIIGDFDSIESKTRAHFSKMGKQLIEISEQESTDFEKCLRYCLKSVKTDITVFGATSMRTDHTLNNFSILLRHYRKLRIKLITEEFEIAFIEKKTKFKYRENEIVSLLAIPKAENIYTKGLMYPLTNESLEFGTREGTLNKSISKTISITFKSGNILLFKKHFIG